MKKRRVPPLRPRCVLDSGGLSRLTETSAKARAWLRWIIDHDGSIVVPTPVLVETITGDARRDAAINHILNVFERVGSILSAPDEAIARSGGRLRYRARSDDGIDALVAATAVGDGSPCVLLTSDPKDLQRLLHDEPQVSIQVV
jgi:predicted nucleic acid-binding protein